MISRVCDICGKIEKLGNAPFESFERTTAYLKIKTSFDLCPQCLQMIRELAKKRKEEGDKK